MAVTKKLNLKEATEVARVATYAALKSAGYRFPPEIRELIGVDTLFRDDDYLIELRIAKDPLVDSIVLTRAKVGPTRDDVAVKVYHRALRLLGVPREDGGGAAPAEDDVALVPLAELVSFLPPPEGWPVRSVAWAEVEARLGTPLPSDYKRIVEVYGLGAFQGFIWLLQPDAPEHLDLEAQRSARLAALRRREQDGGRVPYPVGELLPWGVTSNGDVCYYHADPRDPADEWPIVVNDSSGEDWDEGRGTLGEFLIYVFAGMLRVSCVPDELVDHRPKWVPAGEQGASYELG